MPPSSPADRLAKALHPFLSSKIPMACLKSLGWFDFLSNDRPDTGDPIEMAAAAFLYLSVEADGSWSQQTAVLTGILAFLHTRTGKSPTSVDLLDFKSLLGLKPIQPKTIADWFERVYR